MVNWIGNQSKTIQYFSKLAGKKTKFLHLIILHPEKRLQ